MEKKEDEEYYEGFVHDVAKALRLDEEKERKFRALYEWYGVNWKLEK